MQEWREVRTEVKTVDWKGEPIVLKNVRALQNTRTSRLRFRPYELAQAEIENIADKFGLHPRDVASVMMMFAKPGHFFREGEVFYKYHLQKMLFYLWKELDNIGYTEVMPRDHFIAAKNGPKPEHMEQDLERLAEKDFVTLKDEYWHPEYEKPSKRIMMTDKGLSLAKELWTEIPEPYRIVALQVKQKIHPMEPETVRHLVHIEYPEYKDTYIENDIE